MFPFHEGRDPKAERTFKEIARLTRGAYCHFDAGSAPRTHKARFLWRPISIGVREAGATSGQAMLIEKSRSNLAARVVA